MTATGAVEPAPAGAGQQVYYCEHLPVHLGARFEFAGDEGHHAFAVRRRREGDQLLLSNGEGGWALVQVVTHTRHNGVVEVRECGHLAAPPVQLQVFQAIPKADRAGDTIAALTQAGVDVIVPWQSQHCVSDWRRDKADKGQQRWQRIAHEAAKQSRRLWWPTVTAPIAHVGDMAADLLLICDETAAVPLPAVLATDPVKQRIQAAIATVADDLRPTDSVMNTRASIAAETAIPSLRIGIVVGPEGGFSADERTQLLQRGTCVNLGPTVWRTALAGAIASAFVAAASHRW